jgi:bifunctional DNA-binding transcriptional regulator/antitoxin component of YhaV-PrlF toxin-antitoxin module
MNRYIYLGSQGELVFPAAFRRQLKLSTGTKIFIARQGATLVLRPITRNFIDSLIGCTKGAGAERERMHLK